MSTNYTVNNGDCLWKIVKTQYKDQVKTNGEIQTVVNNVVKTNNIENPNLIHPGDNLTLPAYESIFNTVANNSGTSAANNQNNKETSVDMYEEYFNWQENSYTKQINGKSKEIEMFDFVDSDISYKDKKFMEPWKQGVTNLADGNINASDKDKDGAINYDEYLQQEIDDYNKMFKGQDISYTMKKDDKTKAFVKKQFDAIDADKNGKIEKNELSAYYAALDAYDSTDGTTDGKIQFSSLAKVDLTDDTFQTRFNNALNIFAQ